MNTNEIMHINGRYRKQDCEPIDNSHVMIRIKTGKDIRRVQVVYNDPYIRIDMEDGLYWPYHTANMNRSGDTYHNYFFTVILPCELHRLKYYFLVYDEDDCVQYSESGFTSNYRHDDLAMFFVPYISKSNVFNPPVWVQNTIWYQIMPIRFHKDLRGVINKLEYLRKLGINGIYLNPIYYAHSYHKYDVIDYTLVDPELGTETDMKELCAKAHELDMKVMLDISFTHCSDKNFMFQDVIKQREKSKYFSMFKVDTDEDGELQYECFGMIKSMPKFETENTKTIVYFANEVIAKWMNIGVDAWRIDVANEISDRMLEDVKHVVRDAKDDTYIVGEIWHNASEWISNDGLDGVTNYAVSRAILAFICDPRHDIYKYRSEIDEIIHSYTIKQLKASMPLLDSHDTPRIRTICDNDKDKIKVALLLLLTFYGTPSIYYGTERYMEGGGDPDNRRPTNWEEDSEDVRDMYNITQLFISLRKEHTALNNEGSFEWVHHNELLIIRRCTEQEELFIVVNSKEYDLETTFPYEGRYLNLIDGSAQDRLLRFHRLGFMILKKVV